MANKKPIDFYLMIVLGFSLFVNLGLSMKVHRLTLLVTPTPLQNPTVGSKVESLDASDISGKARHLVLQQAANLWCFMHSPPLVAGARRI
jgi:hypothetical protein